MTQQAKVLFCQDQLSEFCAWNLHWGMREPAPANCPLTSMWHTYENMHNKKNEFN